MNIGAEKLGKRFNREWVFRNFSYQFTPGKFYAITGPNGSGKSTLMQVLWGQMQPSAGVLSYSNTVPSDVFKSVSIAAPYMDLIDEFTLEEMVDFHFKFNKTRIPLDQFLEIINLNSSRQRPIATFSSGMRQRLKLALAFYSKTDALFLDEPCTNLDKNSIDWYRKHLEQVPPETIVLIASNQEQEYPPTADKIDILSYK